MIACRRAAPQALDDERTGAPPASRSTCNAWARSTRGNEDVASSALLRGRDVLQARRARDRLRRPAR